MHEYGTQLNLSGRVPPRVSRIPGFHPGPDALLRLRIHPVAAKQPFVHWRSSTRDNSRSSVDSSRRKCSVFVNLSCRSRSPSENVR
jgi:hypothetical protein